MTTKPAAGPTPASRLEAVEAEIVRAAALADRDPAAVTLVAVSKTFPVEAIVPVLDAGHRVFGENRVQEALGKWPALKAEYPDIELHLIGPLQTNKTREAVGLFDAIHTLDRPRLADSLKAEIQRSGRSPALFVQVNTGEEAQKAGVAPKDAPSLIASAREAGLPVKGLMCIPPVDAEPSPHFALLSKMAKENDLPLLSMGMSADFETAIKFGATHVRVGSALFGARS